MKTLANRMSRIPRTATSKLRIEARGMEDIIDFISPDFDFWSPEVVSSKLTTEFKELQKYHISAGLIGLRKVIAELETKKTGIPYKVENVLITNGVSGALHLIAQSLFDEEDEVLCLKPYWLFYPPIFNQSCKFITFDSVYTFKEKINKNTKAVILNNPSICGGKILSQEEFEEIAKYASIYDLVIISDEIWDHFYYREGKMPRIGSCIDVKDRLLITNGASKTYGAGGWRVGYIVGAEDFIKAFNWTQVATTYGASTLSQAAYLRSLLGSPVGLQEFRIQRNHLVAGLNGIGIAAMPPNAGIGLFPKVAQFYKKLGVGGSEEFCQYLLKYASVLVAPGIDYGDDESVYMTYCLTCSKMGLGILRIENLLRR